jgi:hypothetical protein
MKKKLFFQFLLIIVFLFTGNKMFAQLECNPGEIYTISLSGEGTAIFDAEAVFPDTYTNARISRGGGDPYTESITFDCSEIGDFFINAQATNGSEDVECVVHVDIRDEVPPIAVAEAEYYLSLVGGVAGLTTEDINVASYDNCGIVSMTLSQ